MSELEMVTVTAADPRWEAADVTYRQLDYWTKKGWLLTAGQPTAPGSGHPRTWPESEIEVAGRMARLCAVGLEVSVAAGVARDLPQPFEVMPGMVYIGAGVWIQMVREWSS